MSFKLLTSVQESGSSGRNNHHIVNYIVGGDPNPATDDANNRDAVITWVQGGVADIPLTIVLPGSGLVGYGADLDYSWMGDGAWLIKVEYTPAAEFRPTGETGFSFNTAGGSQHIVSSLSHVQTYSQSGTPTLDDASSLNKSSDGDVQGIDRDVAGFDFQITAYIGDPDSTYIDLLKTLTDTVNASDITIIADGITLNFAAGECRFKGATGSRRGLGDLEVTYNFNAAKNVTGLTVGPITGVAHSGQDYMSVRFMLGQNSGAEKTMVSVPEYVLVDQIYPYENWSGLCPSAGL